MNKKGILVNNDRIILSDKESYSEYLLGVNPPIGIFPNIVVPACPPIMQKIRQVTEQKICWWWNTPRYSYDGGIFEEIDKSLYPKIWSSYVNQKWLDEHGGPAKLGHFTFFANAASSIDFYDKIDQSFSDDMTLCIDEVWKPLSGLINTLKWIYFPLEGEGELAVFVTSPQYKYWVDNLRSICQNDNTPFGTIYVKSDGDEGWNLSDGLRSMA